jgi:ribonuclease BN (tRNA processing enzyme)
VPCYIPGNRIILYSCHDKMEHAIRGQNHGPSFPVEFEALSASIEFVKLETGKTYDIAGARVTGILQMHGNDSYGYRIEKDGKTVIYTTDSEHKPQDRAEMGRVAKFFTGADLVIFDAMYSLADTVSVKEDWGHSSNIMGVELCQMGAVKTLCLFHHEPVYDDQRLEGIFNETLRFEEITRSDKKLDVVIAYDGLVLDV